MEQAKGYDRECYEYALFRRHKTVPGAWGVKGAVDTDDDDNTYSMFLAGPLDTPEKVKEIGGLSTIPEVGTVISGDDETPAAICHASGQAKQQIKDGLATWGIDFKPCFVTFWIAARRLSPFSAYLPLGIDSTLPQHRASSLETHFEPRPDQYPVFHCFYGTPAVPD